MAGVNGSFTSDHTRVIMPLMDADAYKTYGMSMPLTTHWRKATCEEIECEAQRNGWVSTFDLSTELGRKQFAYCQADKSRSYSMQRPSADLVKLVYKPGNECFRRSDHRLPLERPARFVVAGGDWRGNPRRTPARVHVRAEDWVEDFSEHQDALASAIERG